MPHLAPPTGFRGRFLIDIASRSAYSEGAGPFRVVPDAVAVPDDLDDLTLLVRDAAQRGLPLVPRGAGSGIAGGNVGRGIVVDLGTFSTPLMLTPVGTANVGAAVTLGRLEREASPGGWRLGPDPSSAAFCTLGGMVATNAAGARSVRCGSIRRWVQGVEIVTGDGEVGWLGRSGGARSSRAPTPFQEKALARTLQAIEHFERDVVPRIKASADIVEERFPKTSKNSSGYALDAFLKSGDAVDVVIGSEGTLGMVTRVELILEPIPAATASALLALRSLDSLPTVAQHLLTHAPDALELLDRSFLDLARERIELPLGDAEAVLLVDMERSSDGSARDALEDALTRVRRHCTEVRTALSDADRKVLWSVRHAASPALAARSDRIRSLQVIEDGCVPLAALGDYLQGVRAAARAARVPIVAFGHAGDGHLHVNALVDPEEPDLETRLLSLLGRATSLIRELRGTPSGEHGDGRLRTPLLPEFFGPDIMELFTYVKRAFDPAGVMNPGVIVPSPGARPLGDLKVGARAENIPDRVAQGLRRLEQQGGWGIPKLELVA